LRLCLGIKVTVLVLTILVLVSLTYCQPEEWLSIEDEHFIVYYRKGFRSDAEMILKFANFARNVTMRVLPHKLSTKTKIYLYDYKSWKNKPWVAWCDGKDKIYMLTPHDNPYYGKGKYIDDFWYLATVAHEYVHIATYSLTQRGNIPEWLSEGIATYISNFPITYEYYKDPLLIKKEFERRKWYLGPPADMVRRGDGYLLIVSGVRYGGGAYIVKYMFETYGSERMVSFFKALSTLSFADALRKELNVTFPEFEKRWLEWAVKEFNANKELYPLLTEPTELIELRKYCRELKAELNFTKARYTELKKEYTKLKRELDLTRSFMFIFLIVSICLSVLTLYLTRRSNKAKVQAER